VNRVEASQSEDGFVSSWLNEDELATAQFRWIPRSLLRGASLAKNVLMTAQMNFCLGNSLLICDQFALLITNQGLTPIHTILLCGVKLSMLTR